MNCCTEYGECRQGRDCPARTGVVLPHQAAHAKRIEGNECAAEGGNVWFAEPEPDSEPLTLIEAVLIYGGLVFAAIITVAVLAFGAGFIFHAFFS